MLDCDDLCYTDHFREQKDWMSVGKMGHLERTVIIKWIILHMVTVEPFSLICSHTNAIIYSPYQYSVAVLTVINIL